MRSMLPMLVLLVTSAAFAALDSGMALIVKEGDLVLRYLSTGEANTLASGQVFHATFSPDGKQIAYITRKDEVRNSDFYTVNIDGSGNRMLDDNIGWGGAESPQWCTDGYIYTDGFRRYDPQSGASENTVNTAVNVVGPTGDTLETGNNNNDMQMSRDGTRAITTSRLTTGGYGQRMIDMVTHEQFFRFRPCQGGLSPSGRLASVSNCTHRCFRIIPWDVPYEEYADGTNSYTGCPGDMYNEICPAYDTVLFLGADVQAMYSLAGTPEVGHPRFSDHEEDIFLFSIPDAAGAAKGCYAYDRQTMEYTQFESGVLAYCWGFIREEIRMATPVAYTLLPTSLSFSAQPGAPLPSSQTLTLSSRDPMSGDPSVTGVPTWLEVETIGDDQQTYRLVASVVGTALPAEGSYSATLTITPQGSSSPMNVAVGLVVGPPAAGPIVIHRPLGSDVFEVGDTMVVEYSADQAEISGVVIALSLDEGESYTLLNEGSQAPTGSNQLFTFVVPDQLLVDGVPTGTISDGVALRLSNYPSGSETYVNSLSFVERTTITIAAGTGYTPRQLRATAQQAYLRIESPTTGRGSLYDIRGRVVQSLDIARGTHSQAVRVPAAGLMLLRVTGDNARHTTTYVNRGAD